MITVSAQALLRQMRDLIDGGGADGGVDVGPDNFPRYRTALSLELRQLWRSEWFPELMRGEWRYYRNLWVAASTYNKTNEVYDAASQKYFQCLRDTVTGSGNSPTDSAGVERSAYWAECRTSYSDSNWVTATVYAVGRIRFYLPTLRFYQCHTAHTSSGTLIPTATGGNERWGVLTAFDRYIAKDQSWETNEIGDAFDVKNSDPKMTPRWKSWDWDNSENGVQVLDTQAGYRVFVQFRRPPPRLKGAIYSAAATYAVGDQIYFDTAVEGNFYDCLTATSAAESPTSAAAKWSVVQIPEDFEEALIENAARRVLVVDEKYDAAGIHAAAGEVAAQTAPDVIYRQQGKTPPIPARTY